jgi:hypothetical protein
MQTPKTIPEFLCYKYKGVKRADQILASAVQFAWRCRKYQNWKDVQNSPDDKQTLLRFADALLDSGKYRAADYGKISVIFYNVQRWRKDKQELAEEPDILASWSEAECLISVALENPNVVAQKLGKEIQGAQQIHVDLLWDFFYAWTIFEMLKVQKVPALPACDFKSNMDRNRLDEQIEQIVRFFYNSGGLDAPEPARGTGSRGSLLAIYADLGLPTPRFNHLFSKDDWTASQTPTAIVLRYTTLSPLQLMKVEEVEGNIHLSINSTHDYVKEVVKDTRTKFLFEAVASAYAEAGQQMPAHKEVLDTLTSYLGIILKRRASAKSE